MSKENPKKRLLKDGKTARWDARWYGPDGREKMKSFPTEKAAKKHLAKMEVAKADGTYVDPSDSKTTLNELCEGWMAQATTDGTRYARRNLLNNLGTLDGLPLSRVTPPLIRTWLGHLRNGRPWAEGCDGVSPAYQSSLFSQLKAMLNQAEDDQLIPRNPAAKISVPRPDTAVTWQDIPTVAEIRQMITTAAEGGRKKKITDEDGRQRLCWVMAHPDLAVLIQVAAATGMRAGELAGLTWHAVDFDTNRIHVINQAAKHGTGLRPLKTRSKGLRTLSVDEDTMKVLAAHREAFPGRERAFHNHGDRPLVSSALDNAVAQLRTYLELTRPITPKSFRHFHATSLLRAGVPVHVVQARLGHTSSQMTMDVYTHWVREDDDQAAAAIGGILSAAGNVRDAGSHLRAV